MEILAAADCPLAHQRFAVQRIASAGRWAFPMHSHRGFAEIFFLAEGSMEHLVEGRLHRLAAGALVLVRERDHHRLVADGMRYCNLTLPVRDLGPLLGYLDGGAALAARLAEPEPLPPAQLPPGERREVEDLYARLFDCQAAATAVPLYQHALVRLAAPLIRPPPTDAAGPPAWLLQAQTAAAADLATASAAGMAAAAGVSPAHLARSMRRYGGATPAAWLNRCRLERAALRLAHTNQPIAELAAGLGFDSLGWFYRCFRRTYGTPPAAYRRRYGVLVG